jgi:uracil-DNA glycosylase
VGLKGVWDFAKTGDPTAAGLIVGSDPFHAKVEVGAIYTDPSGASLRGSFAYDGIGDGSFQAYHGRASVTIPFN